MSLPHSLVSLAKFMLTLVSAAIITAYGGGSSSSESSALTLAIADAPVDDAEKVVVEFTAVEMQPANGPSVMIEFATPRQIDLLRLTGGVSDTLLDGKTVPAGQYNWLRLHVNAETNVRDSYITINGSEHEMRIPSGAESGLQINRGFTMPSSGTSTFTIDFDLRKSVHQPGLSGGDFLLRPTLRMVDNSRMGMMSGAIDASLVSANCISTDTPAVYVFDGPVTQPDDVDGVAPEPITTARVPMDGQYAYTVPFLESGDYMVAFTCDAAMDQPDFDDSGMVFHGTTLLSVRSGQTMTHRFVP